MRVNSEAAHRPMSEHHCGEELNAGANGSSCTSTCDSASILLHACVQFDARVLLSLASVPLICERKPIPLLNLSPKSYDCGYGNDIGSLCDTEGSCDFVGVLRRAHTSVTGDTPNCIPSRTQLSVCNCLLPEPA